jgi:hypothetical protein
VAKVTSAKLIALTIPLFERKRFTGSKLVVPGSFPKVRIFRLRRVILL